MSLVTLGSGSKCQEGVTRKIKLFHCFENKTLPSFQVLETVQTGRAGVCGITGDRKHLGETGNSLQILSFMESNTKGPEVPEDSGNVSPHKLQVE